MYDHCLIFNLPPEIKSFSCYQELKKGIDKAERELPVKSVNRILEVMKSKKIPKTPDLKLYSLVFIKHDPAKDKSKVRDMYIVMEIDETEEKVQIQKILKVVL